MSTVVYYFCFVNFLWWWVVYNLQYSWFACIIEYIYLLCLYMKTNIRIVLLGLVCGLFMFGWLIIAQNAWANMALANISNTCNGNQITLTWSAVPWADKVAIYKVLNNNQQGTLIVNKEMSAGIHVYTLPNPVAPEVVRFVPMTSDGTPAWAERDYTLRLCNSTTPTTPIVPATPSRPGVPIVPKVWPEQDIAYVLFATLFIYGIVRYARYRKAKS